ncbi:MAG TPA: methyltransferase domain-containing protein, partial [Verrucomicrobiae bacterium]|nr:methyltransferase domain-containing protein [Verrucomicrobiae bacterium]
MDYQREYTEYWSRPDRWGSHSFNDPELIADQILSICGNGKLLDVGFGMGWLVRTLLKRGIDAHGLDVAEQVVREAEAFAPGHFTQGSILSMPYPTGEFQTAVSTDCLEHIAEEDVPAALLELYRVTRRSVFIQLATTPDRDRRWHLTIRDRAWWESCFFEAGFRKHPLIQTIVPYESLENECRQITLAFERIPPTARERHPLAALKAERDLHMDMLRETGRRSDAHIARYTLAGEFVPQEGLVLDAACGLGYGSAILAHSSPGVRVVGIDSSAFAINYGRDHFLRQFPNLEFHDGDVCRLSKIGDGSIATVVSFETIEHLKSPEEFLKEVRRVLRPGGVFIGSVPNMWVDEHGKDPNPWHFHTFDLAKLAALCQQFLSLNSVYGQNAGGGMKLTQAPRQMRQWNLPVTNALDDAEWWIVSATKEESLPVEISSPANPKRLVLLTADLNHPLYSSWLPHWKLPFKALDPAIATADDLKDGAVMVTHDTYVDPGRALVSNAVARGIPTLILADGILEYRNTWDHPQLPPGAIFQPVLGHKIACLGRSQARQLESWGNAGKCEITGSPRFDRYYGLRRRQRKADEPCRVLVMTALTPWFNEKQHRQVITALAHLKQFFSEQPSIGGFGIQAVWRLIRGLDRELGVSTTASDLTGRELAEVLQTVDAVVTTPSTAMLEAMMLGLPVAVLDYTNSPLYVSPAWHITAREHIADVMMELPNPPEAKMLFQETTLHDCLECSTPATPRLVGLLLAMMEFAGCAEESGKALSFPAKLLGDERQSNQRENRFQPEVLHAGIRPEAESPGPEVLRRTKRRMEFPREAVRRNEALEFPANRNAHGAEKQSGDFACNCNGGGGSASAGGDVNRHDRADGKGKLLFISHDASRTGAPMFLLNLLGWMREQGSSDFRIVLRAGGPLEHRFHELGETHVLPELCESDPLLLDVSLIYSNTATNGAFLKSVPGSIPIVTHVHELEYILESFGPENFEEVARHTTHFVACSEVVAANLAAKHRVAPKKISVIHEGIPVQGILQLAADRTPAEVRRWCGIDNDTAVIVGCGYVDWRKGADLFVQMANLIRRRMDGRRKVAFLWIGRLPDDERGHILLHDLRRLGLTDSVKFVGEQYNPYPCLAICDIFCLCSREDPFPLVMLEA